MPASTVVITNEQIEASCDRLEQEQQRLAQDPATRKAAIKLQEVITELSAILARRDNIPSK